ncbi:hypothetical protein BH11PSE7_BH11PSE7_12250 [soil metagenome]
MDDLKFNLYAFTSPKTTAERGALWTEAFRLMDELSDQISDIELALIEAKSAQEIARA